MWATFIHLKKRGKDLFLGALSGVASGVMPEAGTAEKICDTSILSVRPWDLLQNWLALKIKSKVL
jgi:hypothetical protein